MTSRLRYQDFLDPGPSFAFSASTQLPKSTANCSESTVREWCILSIYNGKDHTEIRRQGLEDRKQLRGNPAPECGLAVEFEKVGDWLEAQVSREKED